MLDEAQQMRALLVLFVAAVGVSGLSMLSARDSGLPFSGTTLREIAREQGRTLAGVRAAVLAAFRAELPQTLK